MWTVTRPDPHGYLIIAQSRDEGERIAEYLHIKRYKLILWFNDLDDHEEPPKYRLVVSRTWWSKYAAEQHDFEQLREFISEWERLYPREILWVDLTDERKRIDPGPSPLERKYRGRGADFVILDDLEDNKN